MCGNATRCVAKFIVSRGLAKSADTKVFNLHTKSGLVKPALLEDGRVCVDMGLPRNFLGSIKLTADSYDFTAETVSMGNPHAVIFVDDIEKIQLEKWGSILEVDKQVPDRCNIEFAQVVTPTQSTGRPFTMTVDTVLAWTSWNFAQKWKLTGCRRSRNGCLPRSITGIPNLDGHPKIRNIGCTVSARRSVCLLRTFPSSCAIWPGMSWNGRTIGLALFVTRRS